MPDYILDALSSPLGAEFVRFVETGIASAAVHYGIFWFCYRFCAFHYQRAATTGLVFAFFVNFLLHKFWTYGSPGLTAVLLELPLFSLKKLVFWYVNRRLLHWLVECLFWRPLWAQLLLIPLLGLISYLILKHVFST